MKLDERELDGIYDSAPTESTALIHSTEDVDEVVQLEQNQQSAAQALVGPKEENVEEDAKMPEAESDDSMKHGLATYRAMPGADFSENLIFRPEPERVRRPRDLVLALEDEYKVNDEEHPDNDDHFWPSSPNRPRIDEDGLLADADLAYAASVGVSDDMPTTYQQAMERSEGSESIKAMNSELKAHADNGSCTLVRRTSLARLIGCRWVFAKKQNENSLTAESCGTTPGWWRRISSGSSAWTSTRLIARHQHELDQGRVRDGGEGLRHGTVGHGHGIPEQCLEGTCLH
ncbi:unnamed protein product [Phytophthora fragariaefolia]|uniref:Unnamed protein product n=1 Tax=Phytophthora fragariaefolia TaxID=1490495 RepID=A0A9W6YBL3_9STRA|nr:unnamed protein product [Phytophthora fragariaefolia]